MTSKEMEFLKNAEKEAYQEQKKELDRIFPVLSLSSRAEIVSLAQKLKAVEDQMEPTRFYIRANGSVIVAKKGV